MDAAKPLLTPKEKASDSVSPESPDKHLIDMRARSMTPEVRVQKSSDTDVQEMNLDPGVNSREDSPSDDTQSEKFQLDCSPSQDGVLLKTRSEELPTIVCDDERDSRSLHSCNKRSRLKQMRGNLSFDSVQKRKDDKNYLTPNGSRAPSECGQFCIFSENGSRSSSVSCVRHRITMEEVAPSASSIIADEQHDWKLSIDGFSAMKRGKQQEDKGLPRRIRRYYKTQDELISAFEELHVDVDDGMENAEDQQRLIRLSNILAKVSFACNLLLLIGKAVAAGLTGSLSVISAVIDSGVDLVSGALMWWSNKAIKNRNIYHYPQGRTKLEPIAIVIVSVVMALASVQMVRESIEKIIEFAKDDVDGPEFGVSAIVLCSLTVVIKLVLFILCRRVKTPGTQALAQDHRNDVISNAGALLCGFIGAKYWKYLDPMGAIAISLYIIVSWFITGWEQIKMLTGHTARPDFLKKITWIALNHHASVLLIDTVRAFHFGSNFLVEVDIVLPEEMNLKEAHDIGETLQIKIERLTEVERAFVHLDYECEHSPFSEHKQV